MFVLVLPSTMTLQTACTTSEKTHNPTQRKKRSHHPKVAHRITPKRKKAQARQRPNPGLNFAPESADLHTILSVALDHRIDDRDGQDSHRNAQEAVKGPGNTTGQRPVNTAYCISHCIAFLFDAVL
jgi:hypothetical protein